MQQVVVFVVLAAALVLFVWGRWRYDMVALGALLALVVSGIVEADQAFLGFGHPAVITVVSVLVISRGLERSGFADVMAKRLERTRGSAVLQLVALCTLVAVSSAFMNNVGALALFMPVAIRMARESGRPVSLFLMPLAFASLLGGTTTLIGTPPNIIIATFRASHATAGFGMFDFAPVGAAVTLAGVLFTTLVGWRMTPERRGAPEDLFEMESYLSEVRIPEGSAWIGKRLQDVVPTLEVDITVVGIARGEGDITPTFSREFLKQEDVLLIEAEPADLDTLVASPDLEAAGTRELMRRLLAPDHEVEVIEAVVRPYSRFAGRTAGELELRAAHGVNLLGVARRGRRIRGRLREIVFEPGDVLLLQGTSEAVRAALAALGGLPLAERGVEVGRRRRLALAVAIFVTAIALTVAGLLPVHVSLTAAAVALVATRVVSLQGAYESVEWPVIVLLGAMLPVGEALETTGGASTVAGLLLALDGPLPPGLSVMSLMIATMLLSNVINNAAAAVLMAPVGLAIANGLGASVDPFLMTVAVGSSCAFLTPIGHQSSTLVMGPGGYRFGDYVYLGAPLSVLVVLVGVPMILLFWPL